MSNLVLPIGPLMIEHRLIEKMIALIGKELARIEKEKKVNVDFITTAVDFIKTYADACHHGKEEDILFRELKKKHISDEHNRIMNELIQEHIHGRKLSSAVLEEKTKYLQGNEESLEKIKSLLTELKEFYPKHIEKEDHHFFKPVMKYFTQEELDSMLDEEYEFDKKYIHVVYNKIVNKWQKELG